MIRREWTSYWQPLLNKLRQAIRAEIVLPFLASITGSFFTLLFILRSNHCCSLSLRAGPKTNSTCSTLPLLVRRCFKSKLSSMLRFSRRKCCSSTYLDGYLGVPVNEYMDGTNLQWQREQVKSQSTHLAILNFVVYLGISRYRRSYSLKFPQNPLYLITEEHPLKLIHIFGIFSIC